jgi:hypothetical protein
MFFFYVGNTGYCCFALLFFYCGVITSGFIPQRLREVAEIVTPWGLGKEYFWIWCGYYTLLNFFLAAIFAFVFELRKGSKGTGETQIVRGRTKNRLE